MTGKLYLIPTGLGDNAPLEILPISIKKIIENIDVYIVENEKSARKFIKTVSSGKSQSSLTLFSLNKFTDPLEIPSFLEDCLEGNNVGLLSDAGCPGVADPGAEVVKIAHKKKIKSHSIGRTLFNLISNDELWNEWAKFCFQWVLAN